ncbi:MAG TPA: class I SAM-dependent methyltransferase [Acidimicrobiales bacterium]|nr:class I SAM-dependent methyltransferase [Acidimicrobiales bacterium]
MRVVERVVAEAAVRPGERAVDLGCGSGQLSLRLAERAGNVLAVDVSQAMVDLLERNARQQGITNVTGRAAAVEHLDLPEGSVDVVVSNYALHHLRDPDKAVAVRAAARWLAPGGRLVVGDMMFGRGGDARDREIISSKVAVMLRRGPAGWWRIAKNAVRYLLRVQERPISMAAWMALFEAAGLAGVQAHPVVAEAAVVVGTKPPTPAPGSAGAEFPGGAESCGAAAEPLIAGAGAGIEPGNAGGPGAEARNGVIGGDGSVEASGPDHRS